MFITIDCCRILAQTGQQAPEDHETVLTISQNFFIKAKTLSIEKTKNFEVCF